MKLSAVLLSVLALSAPAHALDVRLAIPAAFQSDLFIGALSASPALAETGVKILPRPVESDAEAMRLVKSGEADLAVFTLANEDQKKLRQAGGEAQILTRPFIFASAEEVFLMQKSFLGSAAAADAGRTGLFPLRIWNHAIAYVLTRDPVRGAEDFKHLVVAAENGGPDARVFAAVGAQSALGAPRAMEGKFNALETRLSQATRDFVAQYGQKLYLTVGWPETGVLAAGPTFWESRSQAEKNAFSAALTEAAAASEADLRAREQAIRALPNVEFTRLDTERQIGLAMMAAGSNSGALHEEMALWKRAEEEVHAAPAPAATPVAKSLGLSPVFFATDRDDERTANLATRFGSRRLDPFEYSCGFLGAPARMSGEPKIPASPLDFSRGAEDCAQMIVKKTRESGQKKILFVIHGFNTTFEGLVWRALQLGSDLDYDGAIVGWSWPSEGSAFSYAYDEDSNAWSEPHFAEFLGEIAAAGPELQLDFVAHSMGNRILLQTLRELAQAHVNYRIGASIFAAPDISQDVFREQIRIAKKIGAIHTLYASQYDHAILISESYHKAPRAGSGGAGILVVNGVESVDARLSGHSYLFDEGKAMMDFRKVVNEATAAAARGLEQKDKAGAAYWVIEP